MLKINNRTRIASALAIGALLVSSITIADDQNIAKALENDKLSAPDEELFNAVRKGDPIKITEALAAGANPNFEACPTPENRWYYWHYTNWEKERCAYGPRRDLLSFVLYNAYSLQPQLIAALAKGGKWKIDTSRVINNLISNTIDPKKPLNDYIPEKLAVAKALNDAGFKVDPVKIEYIKNVLQSQIARLTTDHAGANGIASSPRLTNEGQPNLENTRTGRMQKGEELRRQDEKFAAVLSALQDKRIQHQMLVKTIGQKICKMIDGTEQGPLGTVYEQKFFLTAFTENAVGSKIQLRIASIKRQDTSRTIGRSSNVDRLDGDIILAPNSMIWDDPSRWSTCD